MRCCAGPKTLCNACGVKLVRKNRGTAEAKRRAAAPGDKAAAAAAHLFLDRNSPSPEPWSTGGDSGADETPLAVESAAAPSPRLHELSPLGPQQQQSRRPVRRAAAKAASRTAEYASTGDWPEDEGVVPALVALSVRFRYARCHCLNQCCICSAHVSYIGAVCRS